MTAAVEGDLDEAVVLRVLADFGLQCETVYGKHGKDHLRKSVRGFNDAAKYGAWFVLVDLDREECAPRLVSDWLPRRRSRLILRVAVPQVESWLLAHRSAIAGFLGASVNRVPSAPDSVSDAKECMVNLARSSRWKSVREDMVPRLESRRKVGPAYSSRLKQFVVDRDSGWSPSVAAALSPSLASALRALALLAGATG